MNGRRSEFGRGSHSSSKRRSARAVPARAAAAALATALAVASLVGIGAASADSASSAETAWSPLPSRRAADPNGGLVARGRDVFDQRCAECHGEIPDEMFGPVFLPPMPGTQALQARYRGELPAALEARTDLTPEYIEAVVRDGLRSMPFFRPTELSSDDLEALIAYLTRERDAAAE